MSDTSQIANCLPDLPRWLVIGFSGHRHLDGKETETAAAIARIIDDLAAQHSPIAGVCSAASGADTLFAEAMLQRKAPLSLVLPFGLQRFKHDFRHEPAGAWERAKAIIGAVPSQRIDVVHQLSADLAEPKDCFTTDAPRSPEEKSRDADAYYEATVRTVDAADVLIAVYKQQPGEGRGGTHDAVEYAKARGIPVIIYNPLTATQTPETIELPAALHCGSQSPVDLQQPRAVAEALREHFRTQAKIHKQPSQGLMSLCIFLHLFASMFAAAALIFDTGHALAFLPALLELGVLATVYVVLAVRAQHHHYWLTNRVCAEICRTFLATWDVRRRPSLAHQPRYPISDRLESHRGQEASWLARVLRSVPLRRFHSTAQSEVSFASSELFRLLRFLRQLDTSPLHDLDQTRNTYIQHRLLGEKSGQIPYFRDELDDAHHRYERYTFWGTIASLSAASSALAVVVLMKTTGDEHEMILRIFEFAGTVLPLAATAFTFLVISSDAARRVHRFSQMLHALEKLLPKVQAAPTWDALSRTVTEVEETLLQEIVEWQSFVHYTEHLH